MIPTPSFLDSLKVAADAATVAEDKFRHEIASRTKALETERAFAFRRFNMMRAIAEVVTGAEAEEIAVAAATAVLRGKLGWANDSAARDLVISRFAPVAQAMFASLSPEIAMPASDKTPPTPPDVIGTLAEFERWYRETHSGPFWILFEVYMPETPRVDF